MKKRYVQSVALIIGDILCLALAFVVGVLITKLYHVDLYHRPLHNFFHIGTSKLLGSLILVVFAYHEQYSKRRPFWEEVLQSYRIIALFILINLGMSFVTAKGTFKILIAGFWLTFAFFLPIFRILTKKFLNSLQLWQRDVYIIGSGENAFNAYKIFVLNRLMGYRLKAFVRLDQQAIDPKVSELGYPILSKDQLLLDIDMNQEIEIIVALTSPELNRNVRLVNLLQHRCMVLSILPEISGIALYGAQIDHFFGNDQLVLRLNNNLARNLNIVIKRCFDLFFVFIGLVILSPLFLIIAISIKLFSKSKVFYFHKRIGRNGREFYCIKFQTMYPNSAELLAELLEKDPIARMEWEQTFKIKSDPRVTPIGRWLRKTSLDELPQLFNVLRGEMSLVGPRPIINQEVERYQDGYYYYQLVLPGITGLWQVSGRSDTDYSDRIRLDEWYVKNWSLWYDIVILIKTVSVVLRRSGAY